MENAVRALKIAGAILISVLVLSLFVFFYDKLSSYYNNEHELKAIQDVTEFNKQFANYNKNNIRGNDMLSLINSVIDYNERQAYDSSKKYPRMVLTINISDVTQFQYDTNKYGAYSYDYNYSVLSVDFSNKKYNTIKNTISNDVSHCHGTSEKDADKELEPMSGLKDNLIQLLKTNGLVADANNSFDENDLQKLSSGISNIILDTSDESDETKRSKDKRIKRINTLATVFGSNKVKNLYEEDTYKTNSSSTLASEKMQLIKDVTRKYYEYAQFKKAIFNCTGMEYDQQTGRIHKMEFEWDSEKKFR